MKKEPLDPPLAITTLENRETPAFRLEELVCHCFGYTREDIERDFTQNHRSLLLERIAAEKNAGGCDCANKNPKGC
jgi:hypothetical protein